MDLTLNDRVKVLSTATGNSQSTFAINNGAVTGFETFASGIGVGNTTYYCIFNQGTDEFEIGLGTLNSTTNLQRTTIISSSNSDNVVNFSLGTKDVFCTLPASKAVYLNAAGDAVGVEGGNITTFGTSFSNYNNITSNATTTLATTKNAFLMGLITVSNNAIWTVQGNGALTII